MSILRLIFLIITIFLTASCDDLPDTKEKIPEGTITIGKFRLTGSAQSGPYALKLYNFNRFITDELSQISAWRLIETEREPELLIEKSKRKSLEPLSRTDQIIEDSLSTLENKLFGDNTEKVSEEDMKSYPAADYILVGQMDGFDFDIDRQTHLIKNQTGQDIAGTLNSRAYIAQSTISLRLIKVENQETVVTKRILFRDKITSPANMESQVNEILQRMASRLVAETLLSLAGDIQVAAINQDGTLLLNRGRQSGLKTDMILDLKRPGEWVKDPVTGENLAQSSHKIGSITIESIADNTAIAKYIGDDVIQIKDLAVFDNSQFEMEEKGIQPIRMAIGTVTFSDNSPKAPDNYHKSSLSTEIEQGLAQQLNGKLGIKIVDQESQRIKDMLAQQMLSDLNQGREPGLPLGTLRGVDYLVFMSVVRSELTSPKKEQVYLDALEQSVDQIKPGKGYIKAHVFLQDVNTAETAARTEIKIHKKFKKEITADKAWSELIETLLVKVNKSLLTQLRPLEVLSNANNNIMLSHGKDVLSIGDFLTVFGQGEVVVDPYTGERISHVGAVEEAQLQVKGFQPNGYALADLISGTLPKAGMSVSINEKPSCDEMDTCTPDDTSADNHDDGEPVKKQQEIHQYNW